MLIVWDKKTCKIVAAQSRQPKQVRVEEIHGYDPETMDYGYVDDEKVPQAPSHVELDAEGRIAKIHGDADAAKRAKQREVINGILAVCLRLGALERAQESVGIDLREEITEERQRLEEYREEAKSTGMSLLPQSKLSAWR